ncbi:MAG: hypothetical protein A2252_09945 [Elusimicrobia bacterium RIFOXYA2_FULL_39_19]|nr:MAG: hypothetical protein A2252_09945 [Elusimicrobia bacterium RIFOXYA2_FULL_39_19]
MEPKNIKQKLSAYLDSELSARERQLIEEHLKNCVPCRETLSLFSKQNELLKNCETIEVSSGFRARLKTRLKEKTGKKLELPVFKWIPVPIACAVVVVLFVCFSIITPYTYGITSVDTENKYTDLFKKQLFCFSAKSIIAPLNFIDFYNNYYQVLCECSQKKNGAACTCGGCGK